MAKEKNTAVETLEVTTKEQTGKVSCYYGVEDGEGLHFVKKESSQVQDDHLDNLEYIKPPVDPAVTVELYKQNPFHLRAINFKAVCTCGSGYDIKPDDPEVRDFINHPEYKKLKDFTKKPNEKKGIFDSIMTNLAKDYYLFGYSFLETVRNLAGELAELYNLRSYNTFVKKKGGNTYYLNKGQSKKVTYKPFGQYPRNKELPEASMIKNYNPTSSYYGFADWNSSIGDLVLDRSIVEHAIRNFDNNLMLQFIVIVEGGDMDSKGMQKMQKFMRDNYKGVSNAGKVLVLKSDNPNVKIRIEKISEGIKESGFTNTREQSRDYILASHGIASILLGVKIKGQLGGTTEARDLFKIFNETVIKPEKKIFQETINGILREGLDIKEFHVEFRDLKIETFKDMGILVDLLVRSGLIEENEGRAMLNLTPKEEADKPDDTDPEDKIEKVERVLNKMYELLVEK